MKLRITILTVFRALKPGRGYFEQVDIDLRPHYEDPKYQNDANYPLNRWYRLITEGYALAGRPIEYNHRTTQILRSMNFLDVEEFTARIPIDFTTDWPSNSLDREIVKWYCAFHRHPDDRDSTLESLSLAVFTRYLNWTFDQWKAFEREISHSIVYSEIRVWHTL